jgi:hypothetical protein
VPIVERSWCIVVVGFNWGFKKKMVVPIVAFVRKKLFCQSFEKAPPPHIQFLFFIMGALLGGKEK